MEPVTHVLTGMCLARTGLRRRAAYATIVMATAAEFPDIDTLWGLRGPVSGFQHHRGITHTFLGIPFEAAFLVLLAYLFDRWHVHREQPRRNQVSTHVAPRQAPKRWAELYGFALLALLSHILLDYTNNYGVRPFFPFNAKWYAASIVFIVDPLILLFLLAGLLLPSLFALISQEVGTKQDPFPGMAWARTALCAIVLLWCFRAYEHNGALTLAATETLRAPVELPISGPALPETENADAARPRPLLSPRHSLASPDPFDPFKWYVATDYGPVYQLATVDTRRDTLSPDRILNKPAKDKMLLAAERSRLGQIYLDWSSMPWATIDLDPQGLTTAATLTETTVSFHDLRFMGSSALLQRGGRPPLTGQVVLNPTGEVLDAGMDGKFGR